MSQQFSFRLIGVDAPDGELEVDQLLALVSSLKEIATKIGRTETEADAVGRPPKRTQDVARLTIGLTPGSTKLTVQRLDQPDMLEFATESELGFDERFEAIVTSLADDEKPEWISQPLAIATEKLRNALEKTAPQIEFSVGGVLKRQFFTADTHSRTWVGVTPTVEETSITFVGRLRAVNLDTERFHITDDLSNKVSIRNVANVENLGALLDKYVVGLCCKDWRQSEVGCRSAPIRRLLRNGG